MNRSPVYLITIFILSAGFFLASYGVAYSEDLFTVGEYGASYHYDGTEWRSMVDNSYDYHSIWAFSETDIYVIASISNIYHYDGVSWNSIYEYPGDAVLREIWAASSSDIFVAGSNGLVLHYDGVEWTDISIPSGAGINSIWGTSGDNVYAASDTGGYLYTVSEGWQPVQWRPEYNEYKWNAVWCGGEDEVFFVSDPQIEIGTIIVSYDGYEWDTMQVPEENLYQPINDMWGISRDFVYAVGKNGTILLFDYQGPNRMEWVESPTSIYYDLKKVSGTSTGDVFICGILNDKNRLFYSVEGGAWQWGPIIDEYIDNRMSDVFSLPEGPVFIAGHGRNFGHFEQDQYFRWTPEVVENLKDVWASAPDNVYAVGSEGGIYNYDFDRNIWSEVARPTSRLNAIWGSSENDIYAAGENVYHYDGVNWDLFLDEYIVDVCGTSSDNVYFAGSNVYQFNGSEVNSIGTGPGNKLGIWASDENNVFLGAYYYYCYDIVNGQCVYLCFLMLYHYDGLEWSEADCYEHFWNPCGHFEGGIGGSGPDNVWVTGGNSWHIRYDGVSCDIFSTTNFRGRDIWTAAPDNVYFCSYDNSVYHYDGVTVSNVFTAATGDDGELLAIYGLKTNLTSAEIPKPGQSLSQNHPNPFNPTTTISFSLRAKGPVSIAVYDVAGRLVHVLVDDVMDAGPHDVTWDGRNKEGLAVASGVYFYRLHAGEFNETRKMVLLR